MPSDRTAPKQSLLDGSGANGRAQLFDVGGGRAEVSRAIEGLVCVGVASELREGPGAAELRGGVARVRGEDGVVGGEGGRGVALDVRDRGEAELVLRALRIRGEALPVGRARAVVVVEVHADEAEDVEGLGVVGAALHRFGQALLRFFGLVPARAAHAAFARAFGGIWRELGGCVVGREGLVEALRDLERVAHLDPRRRIVRALLLEDLDLLARAVEVAGEREDADEEAARGDVVGVLREIVAQRRDGFGLTVEADELLGAIDGAWASARSEQDEGERCLSHIPVLVVPAMNIQTIGVLGAGQMGGGIAQVAAAAGYDVVLCDATQELAEKGKAKIAAILGKQVEKGKMTAEAKDALVGRIKTAGSPAELKDCDLVVEAATENVDLKIKLFKQCDEAMKPGAILASNTSSISLTKLAGQVKRPSLVVGMHFMNPPPLMKLVEIVKAVQTSDETYAAVKAAAEKMGKTCTTSNDAPGFLVNRILVPMLCEACFALQEGVGTAADIDTGAKLGLNHPMGPLELSDLIGLDTVLAIADVLHRDIGDDKYRAPTMLRNLVAAGWLGKKSGRGFYEYDQTGAKKA